MPKTMFEKIWDSHVVSEAPGDTTILYIDRHLVHDSGFHARVDLAKRGLKVRRPQNTFGTPDHYVPTVSRNPADAANPEIRRMVDDTVSHYGRLDILVNCIGLNREEKLLDVTEENFDLVYSANLKSEWPADPAAPGLLAR